MTETIELYTVNDIAKSLNMTIQTVRDYIKRGDLIASKIGRQYIVTSENYRAFIEAHQI